MGNIILQGFCWTLTPCTLTGKDVLISCICHDKSCSNDLLQIYHVLTNFDAANVLHLTSALNANFMSSSVAADEDASKIPPVTLYLHTILNEMFSQCLLFRMNRIEWMG